MPIYDYRCAHCDEYKEHLRSPHDENEVLCDKCGKPMNRVYSPAGIIFKGKGFYKTDYRSNGKAPVTATTEKPAAEKTATDTAAKPASCPAGGNCNQDCG